MVLNRRATKTDGGKLNPPEAWIWSSRPTHEALISLETFTQAQQVGRTNDGSRSAPGENTAHPDTKRSYALRSYITCIFPGCGRRMNGKETRGKIYYVCRPPKGYVPEGHPKSIWVREEPLIDGISEFFDVNVFGPKRRLHLAEMLAHADATAAREHQEAVAAAQKTITDLEARRTHLLRSLELPANGGDDLEFARDIRARAADLAEHRNAKLAELRELEATQPVMPSPELLDLIPQGTIDLDLIPEPLLRRLFEAFRLEVIYDDASGIAECRVTLIPEAISTQRQAAQEAIKAVSQGPTSGSDTGSTGATITIMQPSVRCTQQHTIRTLKCWSRVPLCGSNRPMRRSAVTGYRSPRL